MKRRPLGLVCLVFLLLIALIQLYYPLPIPDYSMLDGQEYFFYGKVYSKEYRHFLEDEILIISIKNVSMYQNSTDKRPTLTLKGVQCSLSTSALEFEPQMGSMAVIKGKFKVYEEATNPGQFNSRQYYQLFDLDGRVQNAVLLKGGKEGNPVWECLYKIKRQGEEKLERILGSKEASVMKAMLFANKAELDSEVKELYTRNGIIHVLTISGLHISFMGNGIFKLLRKIGCPIWSTSIVSAFFIILYGIMIGAKVASLRAIFMFLLYLLARVAGRTYDILTAFFLSAVLLVIRQPGILFYSGFLLSYAGILGIAVLMPVLVPKQGMSPIKQLIGVNACVLLVALPIHMCFFFASPIYAALLNLLILPLSGVILGLGFCILLIPMVLFPISYFTGALCSMLLGVYEAACKLVDTFPFHTWIMGVPDMWQLVVYYGMLLSFICLAGKWKWWKKGIFLLTGLVILSLRFSSGMEITCLDVGQGDSIYIKSASGKSYLFDCGSSNVSNVGTYRLIPFLKYKGVPVLEAVFVSHSDEDHCNGILELLEQSANGVKVKKLILSLSSMENEGMLSDLVNKANEKQIPVFFLEQGMEFWDEELRVLCLYPKNEPCGEGANANSQVFYLQYGEFSGLLTGDLEGTGESQVVSQIAKMNLEPVSFLKVAHHGSGNSTYTDFLESIQPKTAVISCSKSNRYGHPHPDTINRLEHISCHIWYTKDVGAVTIRTNGAKISIEGYLR